MLRWLCVLLFLALPPVAFGQDDDNETVAVVVARGAIPRGTVFIESMLVGEAALVAVQQWDATLAPQTALQDPTELLGQVAAIDHSRNMPILSGNLADNTVSIGRVGSDAALILPPGLVGVPIRVDDIATAPWEMVRGDCVSVIGLFDFGGETPVEMLLGEAGLVLENIFGTERVTVAVSPENAAAIVWAADNGFPVMMRYAQRCP